MRRMVLAAGIATVVVTAAGAVVTGTSQAGPPPPPPPFDATWSSTSPAAGRTFTAVLVGHWPRAAWNLSCSASVRGNSIATHHQEFGVNPWGVRDMRSCTFHVPPRTAGSVLGITIDGSDSNGNTFSFGRSLRIFGHASMTAVSAGPPQPDVIYDKFLSRTPPVAGRAFTAAFVQQETGGPWTFRCSPSLRGHSIVAHRQEFGYPDSVPDIRTCAFQVPRQTAGKLLDVTVDATTPDGQAIHVSRTWRIGGTR